MQNPIIPDLQACILCEDVRAEISGQQTLVGVIHAIPAPAVPVAFFKLCLWTRWCGGEGRFKQRSVIVKPDDSGAVGEAAVEFNLQGMESHATNVHVFGGVRFEQFGIHTLEIYLDDQLQLRFPIPVVQVRQQG